MSFENHSLQHTSTIAKPKLTLILPDPSRYSPSSSGSQYFSSQQQQQVQQQQQQKQQNGLPLAVEPKLSLPSIRELLNTNEAQPQPYHQQPQQYEAQAQPQNQSQQFIPPATFQNIYTPQHQQQMYHYQQPNGRVSPNVLVVPNMVANYNQPQQPQPMHQLPGRLPIHQLNTPLPPQRSVSSSSTSSYQSMPSNASTPASPVLLDDSKEKRKKRQNLPRQTTLILLNWLSEHLDRPYPNSREKYELLMKTRLTIQQLDNWFINARRRKINILKKLKENEQPLSLTF